MAPVQDLIHQILVVLNETKRHTSCLNNRDAVTGIIGCQQDEPTIVLPWQPPADNNVCFCLVKECYMYICWKIKLLLPLQPNLYNTISHYNDVIYECYGVSNHRQFLFNSCSGYNKEKYQSAALLYDGNPPVTSTGNWWIPPTKGQE